MILVFGDGLLGTHLCAKYQKDTILVSHKECDITDSRRVFETIANIMPDAVVNAAGLVRGRGTTKQFLEVNGFAPWNIVEACDTLGCKLIHISTDCVFNGSRGRYTEQDQPDELQDVYGWSKSQGEITYSPHLTIRTSFVGLPDPKGRSLLGWLVGHKPGSVVDGYTNQLWNGLTTLALADYIMEFAYSRHFGLAHLGGQIVSKYEVLNIVTREFELPYKINPVEIDGPLDRTLKSTRADIDYIPGTSNFSEMIREMQKWHTRILSFQKSQS